MHVESGTYYIPRSKNQVGFDSFICADGFLYIFQFTLLSNHDINPKMAKYLTRISPISEWRFVFVTPSINIEIPTISLSRASEVGVILGDATS